jgi:hypothetical protein
LPYGLLEIEGEPLVDAKGFRIGCGERGAGAYVALRVELLVELKPHRKLDFLQAPAATLSCSAPELSRNEDSLSGAEESRLSVNVPGDRLLFIDESAPIDLIVPGRADGFFQKLGNVELQRHRGPRFQDILPGKVAPAQTEAYNRLR